LGGTTALLKAHCSLVLELVASEAVQVLGGIGHTRGGQGERIERIRRDVKGVAIPGGSEEVLLDFGVRQEIRLALGLGAKL
jgi:alkylation response protein AidB-like acyl-CoA dehydrogenase